MGPDKCDISLFNTGAMMREVVVFLAVISVRARPMDDLTIFNDGKDTAIVESKVREVRAIVPDKIEDLVDDDTEKAFLHTYSDSDGKDNERGYHKRDGDENAKGYKHFDSFHKKDGDKYGFEHYSAYGKDSGEGDKHKKNEKSHEDKESYEEEGDEQDDETKNSYKVIEDVDEDGDSGRYQEDEDVGPSESYTSAGYTKGNKEDEEDNGHQREKEEVDEDSLYPYRDYVDDGSSGRYTSGNSGYSYGSDEGTEEPKQADKSKGYTAAEDEEDDY